MGYGTCLERPADEEDPVEEGASVLVELPPRPPEEAELLLQPVELRVVVVGRRAALVPLLDALDLRCNESNCAPNFVTPITTHV